MEPWHKRITGQVVTHVSEDNLSITITLQSGDTLRISREGNIGQDSNWHEWLVLRLNGVAVLRK